MKKFIILWVALLPVIAMAITVSTTGGSSTLTGLGIPNHNLVTVDGAGTTTFAGKIKVTDIQANTSAGIGLICSNGSEAGRIDGGGSCAISSGAFTASINMITPAVLAKTSAGLSLKDDAGTTGLIINDGGKVGINSTSTQGQLNVSGDVRVTGDMYVKQCYVTLAKTTGVQVSITGTTNQTTAYTYTIPAGSLGIDGKTVVTFLASFTNNSNNKTFRISFGGTNFFTGNFTTSQIIRIKIEIQNLHSASSQIGFPVGVGVANGTATGSLATGSVNTASDVTVTITGQLANAGDTITFYGSSVEIIR